MKRNLPVAMAIAARKQALSCCRMTAVIFKIHFLDRSRCALQREEARWEFDTDLAALEAARAQAGSEGAKVEFFDQYGRRIMVVWF